MMVAGLVLGSCRVGSYEEESDSDVVFKLEIGKKWRATYSGWGIDSGSYTKSGKTLTFKPNSSSINTAEFKGKLDGKKLTITTGYWAGVYNKKAVEGGVGTVYDVEFEDGVQDELDGPDDEE
jgi:hypothetical protein